MMENIYGSIKQKASKCQIYFIFGEGEQRIMMWIYLFRRGISFEHEIYRTSKFDLTW